MTIAFIDTETIRLTTVPGAITVWEIGLIVGGEEYHWQLNPDMALADDAALKVGRFHERLAMELRHGQPGDAICISHPGYGYSAWSLAGILVDLTRGVELWGSNPAFDMRHIAELLGVWDLEPAWHYHPGDIPSMARGWCAAKGITPVSAAGDGRIRSDDWSRAIGIDPDVFDRHSALGDARWVRAQYALMMGGAE